MSDTDRPLFLENLLRQCRYQWIHSVHAEQIMRALGESEEDIAAQLETNRKLRAGVNAEGTELWAGRASRIACEEISKIDSTDVIPPVQMLQILKILNERRRQDEKWGGVEHDNAHTDREWFAILAGEAREVMRAIADPKGFWTEHSLEEEITHVAAVAVSWLEAIHRRKHGISGSQEIVGSNVE